MSTPGSDAALLLGCMCPVLDNAHGRIDQRYAVTSMGCPLHWPTRNPLPDLDSTDGLPREDRTEPDPDDVRDAQQDWERGL